MIEVNNNGILIEVGLGEEAVSLLWEILDVVGFRYVIVAELGKGIAKMNYSNEYELVEKQGVKVMVLKCDSKQDYLIGLSLLSDLCITDFYITINSNFENVLNTIKSNDMFMNGEFLKEEYLIEYPITIHIKEESIFVDFNKFKEYTHQLKRVIERYQ